MNESPAVSTVRRNVKGLRRNRMAIQTSVSQGQGQYVRANGIDIHYIDLGHGRPLLALNNGMVSTNPIWLGHPAAYGSHLTTLAEHFRVLAPDTRGSSKTRHPGGPITV